MYAYVCNCSESVGTIGIDEATYLALEKRMIAKCGNKYKYIQDTVYTHNFMNMYVDSKGVRRCMSQVPVFTQMESTHCFISYDEKQVSVDLFPTLNQYSDVKARNIKSYTTFSDNKKNEIIVSFIEEKYDRDVTKHIVRLEFKCGTGEVTSLLNYLGH